MPTNVELLSVHITELNNSFLSLGEGVLSGRDHNLLSLDLLS
jgi:hypothetical protein